MKPRKYTNIRVAHDVYVNSQCDYTFHIHMTGFGHAYYNPSVGFWTETAEPKFPKYVVEEVDRQMIARLKSPNTVYYEYDRDGNERYENLRYYDAEFVASWVASMEAQS